MEGFEKNIENYRLWRVLGQLLVRIRSLELEHSTENREVMGSFPTGYKYFSSLTVQRKQMYVTTYHRWEKNNVSVEVRGKKEELDR